MGRKRVSVRREKMTREMKMGMGRKRAYVGNKYSRGSRFLGFTILANDNQASFELRVVKLVNRTLCHLYGLELHNTSHTGPKVSYITLKGRFSTFSYKLAEICLPPCSYRHTLRPRMNMAR